ncbi:MAG: metal ABC transporter ATP-binding protein [Patescibacteria group bacterium]
MPETALQVKDVTVDLAGHRVLESISFTVPVGSTTAIIGPNGAGKSVLVKTILRLIPKTSGAITILGTPHERYQRAAHQVSYVPQRLELDRDFPLTVHGLFSLKSRRPLGMAKADAEHMQSLLATVGISGSIDRRLSDLSGGQLQRVMIAYSLMDHPKLLFLDEPAAGIDVSGQETVYALIRRIQKQENLTVVFISHELDVVMHYADQVVCLNQKLLCAGIPSEALTTEVLHEMYQAPTKHYHHHHHT